MDKSTTHKYKVGYIITSVIDWLLVLLPPIVFMIIGFATAETTRKIVLGVFFFAAVGFGALSIILKLKLKCVIWIFLIGLTIGLNNVMVIVLTIGICTIVDELVIEPAKKYYKSKYTINKEIDKRIE